MQNEARTLTVYLAGPMDGLTLAEAGDWRALAARVLTQNSPQPPRRVINPITTTCMETQQQPQQRLTGNAGSNPLWTFIQDVEKGVAQSDVMLVGYPTGFRHSLGTAFELGVAYMLGIPIVIWCSENPPEHPFLEAARAIHMDLHEACHDVIVVAQQGPQTFEEAMGAAFHQMRKVMSDRQAKYGPLNITNGGVHGLITRMQDKLARIRQDHKDCPFLGECRTRDLPDEQRDDAWMDLANYSGIIALALLHGHWGLPMLEQLPGAAEKICGVSATRTDSDVPGKHI